MSKLCPLCDATYADGTVFCAADGAPLRGAAERDDLIDSVVADRYLVTDKLGEGGMGTVYLARHVRLPQQAAIKVLRRDMPRDAAAVARFNREAANASKIVHDRVARVYDFGETTDGVVYIAMEYVKGKTLKALLADGPMEPTRAANIVKQIAEGLDAAHRMRVVHRDLKPDNIMVIVEDDGMERVKVVDFGIAKALGADDARLTRTGFVVGTPEFMSPEQFLGEAVDPRSDVYALAIVAYRCLTGDLPFPNDTPEHALVARLTTPARPLGAVQPAARWPRTMQALFDQALAREPARRPASAGAFARALTIAVDTWHSDGPTRGDDATHESVGSVEPAEQTVDSPGPSRALAVSAGSAGSEDARITRLRRWLPAIVATLAAAAVLRQRSTLGPMRHSPDAPIVRAQHATVLPPDSAALPSRPAATPGAGRRRRTTERVAAPSASRTRTTAADTMHRAASDASPRSILSTATAAAAHDTLESTKSALYSPSADSTTARAALVALPALLPRLVTADDSAWALASLARAHVMLREEEAACAALRGAGALVAKPGARAFVQTFTGELACR